MKIGSLITHNTLCSRESPFEFEIHGETSKSYFREVYGNNPISRIVESCENFVAIVDLSPLVEGHILIIPKMEILSFAFLNENLWNEFNEFRIKVVKQIVKIYGSVILFEHGSTISLIGSACISHAHIHIIPLKINFYNIFKKNNFKIEKLKSYNNLPDRINDEPYLLFQNIDGSIYLAKEIENSKRQFFRREVAKFINLPDPKWHWQFILDKNILRLTFIKYQFALNDK